MLLAHPAFISRGQIPAPFFSPKIMGKIKTLFRNWVPPNPKISLFQTKTFKGSRNESPLKTFGFWVPKKQINFYKPFPAIFFFFFFQNQKKGGQNFSGRAFVFFFFLINFAFFFNFFPPKKL